MPRKKLYLYLISQSENNDYDTYSDAVVAAYSEEDAKHIHPSEVYVWRNNKWVYPDSDSEEISSSWTTPDNVQVKVIGVSNDTKPGIILSSFHAG